MAGQNVLMPGVSRAKCTLVITRYAVRPRRSRGCAGASGALRASRALKRECIWKVKNFEGGFYVVRMTRVWGFWVWGASSGGFCTVNGIKKVLVLWDGILKARQACFSWPPLVVLYEG